MWESWEAVCMPLRQQAWVHRGCMDMKPHEKNEDGHTIKSNSFLGRG